MGAFQDLNVKGVVQAGLLELIPVGSLLGPLTSAVAGLGKLFGIDGAPPPVTGFLLLGAGGSWTLSQARHAEWDVGRAIFKAHGVPEKYWGQVQISGITYAQIIEQGPALTQTIKEAQAEYAPHRAATLAINKAYEQGGMGGVQKHLAKSQPKLELLKLQLFYLQSKGKSAQALKLLLQAADAELALEAAKGQLAPAPKGFEDGPAPATAAPSSSASSSGLAQVGEGLLGLVGAFLNPSPTSTSALVPSVQGSTPESGAAAASAGVMSPALVVALVVALLIAALLRAA